MTFYLILFGGITAFAVALVLLDWLGRRYDSAPSGRRSLTRILGPETT